MRVPEIADIHDWDALVATFVRYDRVYVPWELAEPLPLREVFERDARDACSVLVVIGPEGGFSAEEVARARGAGARADSQLGRRILRTETAALVVLSALFYARASFELSSIRRPPAAVASRCEGRRRRPRRPGRSH